MRRIRRFFDQTWGERERTRAVGDDGVCRLLIVDDTAHEARGHFPVMCMELGHALREAGCEVTVLTSEGWALEGADAGEGVEVLRLGVVGRTVRRWLSFVGLRAGSRVRTYLRIPGDAVMLFAARMRRRSFGADGVVVTSFRANPFACAIFAGGGHWLVYGFYPTAAGARSRLVSYAERAELRRRQRGGLMRLALNSDDNYERWEAVAPWFEPVRLPFIACRPRLPIPDARSRLGLDSQEPTALLFGHARSNKDLEVVYDAFERLPDWRLVIAGGEAAEAYVASRPGAVEAATGPRLFWGYASEETRDLHHAAADLVVLSFRPGVSLDSGTLVDAISWGLPIVCSDQCYAGEVVARLGLGAVFRAGDVVSLIEAVQAAPRFLDDDVIRAARAEFSAQTMAQQHLDALRLDPHRLTRRD